jgi:hypothetical protein
MSVDNYSDYAMAGTSEQSWFPVIVRFLSSPKQRLTLGTAPPPVHSYRWLIAEASIYSPHLLLILRKGVAIQGIPGGMCQTSGGCSLC